MAEGLTEKRFTFDPPDPPDACADDVCIVCGFDGVNGTYCSEKCEIEGEEIYAGK